MGRVTIHDIAREAGVSTTAVSFALNNHPGVSTATKERILTVARQHGWIPHPMAQALSRARAQALGYVIARPRESYAAERFFFDFLLGLESQLTSAGLSLVLQTCATTEQELEIYRKWSAQGRVDGVVVTDPVSHDPRVSLLQELNLPGVFVGEQVEGFPSLITDESGLIDMLAEHLHSREASRITYVGGNDTLLHTRKRRDALRDYGRVHNLPVHSVICHNSTEAEGFIKTSELLADSPRLEEPQAFIYDNEVLAMGGLRACNDLGARIGREVLLSSCEDSPLCTVTTPTITAVTRDPALYAATAVSLLEEYLTGKPVRNCTFDVSQLTVRSSTVPDI